MEIVSIVANKLASLLAKEYELLSGVQEDFRFMKEELEYMLASLHDLASLPDHTNLDKIWMQDVRSLAQDIEKWVDKFNGLVESSGKNWLSKPINTVTTAPWRHQMAFDIKKIKDRAMEIAERRKRYTTEMRAQIRVENQSGSQTDQQSYDVYVSARMTMHITIRYAGDAFQLEVKKSVTVASLKQIIREKTGIKEILQTLIHSGGQLDDDTRMLVSYGIGVGSVVQLEICPTYTEQSITVRVEGIRSTIIRVRGWYTLEEVKRIIESLEEVTSSDFELFYRGTELSVGKSLQELGIKDGDVLDVYSAHQIFIKPAEGSSMTGNMLINFRVIGLYTISKVKSIIESMYRIPSDDYQLFFCGTELSDGKTLYELGIKDGDTLDMYSFTKIFIMQENFGRSMIRVQRWYTISEMKRIIASLVELTSADFELFYRGAELSVGKSLQELGIKDGDVLDVYRAPQIFIKLEKGSRINIEFGIRSFSYRVSGSYTISKVKSLIQMMSKIPSDDYQLFFCGTELSNGKTLYELGIKDGDTLDLYSFIKIFIMHKNFGRRTFKVLRRYTISELKRVIESLEGVTFSDYELFYRGTELSDGQTIQELGIKDGDALRVYSVPQIVINIKPAEGCSNGFRLIGNRVRGTISNLRSLVDSMDLIPSNDYELVYRGTELSDGQTIRELGIKDGDELDVYSGPQIFINIKPAEGSSMTRVRLISYRIRGSYTISKVKSIIESSMIGIPSDDCQLFFCGTELSDGKTLYELGIKDGDTLDMYGYKSEENVASSTLKL